MNVKVKVRCSASRISLGESSSLGTVQPLQCCTVHSGSASDETFIVTKTGQVEELCCTFSVIVAFLEHVWIVHKHQ